VALFKAPTSWSHWRLLALAKSYRTCHEALCSFGSVCW